MSDPRSIAPVSGGEQEGRALFQKAMRFIDYVAGDGEHELTTDSGEHLASFDLCKEFAELHGCEITDEAYSVALGYPLPPAPGVEARSAETGTGSVEDESPVDVVEAPDNTSDLSSLRAEINTLRTALAFYADDTNYRLNGPLDPNSSWFTGGNTAAQALACTTAKETPDVTG